MLNTPAPRAGSRQTYVEVSTPNVYLDQIEYFCHYFSRRSDVCNSVHPQTIAIPASPARSWPWLSSSVL
ncbi:Isopropylmalate/homocitrate/citramalate synthases [Enterobacter hormaechei]|nr:hypothetical protein SS58_08350 [Enterobacter hormaechei subsp. hoffmannii]MBA7780468.1 hypothetical protein [Enterobacter hormaechei]QLP84150.1 hypothetical protein HV054_16700 [Enterobacter hormaechei]CZW03867.1 Isopropylmalate/homocitrate/citramalate synthases [Enterobacter hormaechei]CZW65306.1 Isopropylmalate/homocitrate/citramalate synthases [Enterobacter hormaechei]